MPDEVDVDLARGLDELGPVKRFKGPSGQKSRVIVVKDKTRIPLILLALSIATAISGGGLYAFRNAKLVEERRENEKRFIAVLESEKKSEPRMQSLPPEKKNAETLNPPLTQKRSVVTLNPRPVQKPSEPPPSTEGRTIPSITGEGTVPAFTVESLPPPEPAKK